MSHYERIMIDLMKKLYTIFKVAIQYSEQGCINFLIPSFCCPKLFCLFVLHERFHYVNEKTGICSFADDNTLYKSSSNLLAWYFDCLKLETQFIKSSF